MNKIQKGKRSVIIIGVCALVLALASLAGGVWAIVDGIKNIAGTGGAVPIIELLGGVLLCIIAFLLIYAGIYFTWVGATLKAFNGSIADGDLCKGTVNMNKCANCGAEIKDGDETCAACGKKIASTKKCAKCGAEVRADAKHCTKCGEDL